MERWGSGNSVVTQKKLDEAILRYVIHDVKPLSTIESPAFIDLIRLGKPSHIRIMCRKTLREKIGEKYIKMKTALENKLSEIDFIATTADLWSKSKRLVISFYNFLNFFT